MNYLAFTAFIITFHHFSALCMLIIALIIWSLSYALIVRKLPRRWLWALLSLVIALLVGYQSAQHLFEREPISFELVEVG